MHRTDMYSQYNSIIWPIWLNGWVFFYKLSGCGFESRCSHISRCTSHIAPVSSKEFLDIQAATECEFTLKRVRDIIRTYSQMHRTDKYSQYSSIIWTVWLNGCVFVYKLSGCGFESRYSHSNYRPWMSFNSNSNIFSPKTDAYLGHYETSKMQHFCKHSSTTKSHYSYFRKKLHWGCLIKP